ncbi:uncharacterized protein HMPREF1541_07989 [Cyphellophora europaea CBS 101466]|uniref:Hydantoinase/oxoprolinase n=1 Tax=Cyphellophora europaea (strain CBS 101466) TaxID=1220924 RepID=W2RKK4_CYPE1|nr:uncharacterized protein HMPREF1541_07989 [Cyphellophora europaea CBS 101466]ETN37001.1 hypothetical protein HMPREF1541_07989 [Cyphellophora europaea CBS 101466]
MFRIGVDVGGTNTDSALLDVTQLASPSRGVLATCKTPTTPNVTEGIQTAIQDVLLTSRVDRSKILNVAIGTTHFVNAVVEKDARRLSKVAVLRLCGPYTRQLPPFIDFPYALKAVIQGPHYFLNGGLEIDGREITPLNEQQIRDAAAEIHAAGISALALVGVFSALDSSGRHEERAKAIIQEAYPHMSVVCSHTIGGPGLLERENATILNASILAFARRTVAGFRRAMQQLNLRCPLYVTQNDGTLADAAAAAELPVKTFASGPTNSLMGAAFLQGLGQGSQAASDKQVIVVDIGGTTTDICALLPSGFPRQAPNFVEVGGVRTAFSMPEVFSIGLGGGSRVREDGAKVTIGPDSVAHRLKQEALVFGGQALTTTDVIVAAGGVSVGDTHLVKHITPEQITRTKTEIKRMIEKAVDAMKVSAEPVVVLLVGGGSILVTDDLDGVEQCLCPPHHDSANAVGAAIAKVSGEVDLIEVLLGRDEAEILASVKKRAVEDAIARGADPDRVDIVQVEKIPLQYVTNKATRLVVKAVGDLKVSHAALTSPTETNGDQGKADAVQAPETRKSEILSQELGSLARPTLDVDLNTYRPEVRDRVWYLSPVDVELIASGTGILGTGGGGSSYNMALHTLNILRQQGPGRMRVVAPESLADDDICVEGAGYGAPSVSNERIASGQEVFDAVDTVNRIMGYKDFTAIVAVEIGGGNGLVTFPSSAHYDRPVVDCDLMGRAYPTIEHTTPYLFGEDVCPCATTDGAGNAVVAMNAQSYRKVEGMIRTACIELGNATAAAGAPFKGSIIKKYAVPNTVSQAWFLGRAVHMARQTKVDFIKAIGSETPVKLLYTGKVIDVTRDVSRGYTVGRCLLAPLSSDELQDTGPGVAAETRNMVIPFQNEYLAAAFVVPGQADEAGEMACTVPDLISILGQDGEALGSPELRYGLRVKVIAMPASPIWTKTERGLQVGGPEFFQLGCDYKSIGEYQKPRSVIDEFSR